MSMLNRIYLALMATLVSFVHNFLLSLIEMAQELLWLKVELDYDTSSGSYDEFIFWMSKNSNNKSRFKLVKIWRSLGSDIIYSPSPGYYPISYKGRYYLAHVVEKDQGGDSSMKKKVIVYTAKWNREPLDSILAEGKELYKGNITVGKSRISVYICDKSANDWCYAGSKIGRPLNSVVLKSGIKEDIVKDFKDFLASESRYSGLGIPWRRGYLFNGPPGTGKSSLTMALASYFDLSIYSLNLADEKITDSGLQSLLAKTEKGSIVLLEDIDCVLAKRSVKGYGKLSFSGLLNCLDGVSSTEGRIIVATTNHVSQLDPALTRPGRFDKVVQIENAGRDQIAAYYAHFMKVPFSASEIEPFVDAHEGKSMAEIQGILIDMNRQKLFGD